MNGITASWGEIIKGGNNVFILQRLEQPQKHIHCTIQMLTVISEHIQYLDMQRCPDKSIPVKYYAAGEDHRLHPSSMLYFMPYAVLVLHYAKTKTNTSKLKRHLRSQIRTFGGDFKVFSKGQFDFGCVLFDIPLHYIWMTQKGLVRINQIE